MPRGAKKVTMKAKRGQEAPGGAKRCQEVPIGAKEVPMKAKRGQEAPGGAKTCQEGPIGARTGQKRPGGRLASRGREGQEKPREAK